MLAYSLRRTVVETVLSFVEGRWSSNKGSSFYEGQYRLGSDPRERSLWNKNPRHLQAGGCLLDPVVAIYRAGSRIVRPIPRIVVPVFGSAFQLLLGDTRTIASEIGIILQ